MKLLLSLILIISIISNINCSTITFDSSKDCVTQECQFSTASNWIGGIVPKAGDTVIIPSLGSKSVVVSNSIEEYASLTITNLIFKLTAPTSSGSLSNVILKENAQFILDTGKISLNSVSGDGLLIVDASSATADIEITSSTANGGLFINNNANATISDSTFGFISQYDSSEFGQGPPRQLLLSGTNKVGGIYILGSDISFNGAESFTIDGSILPSKYNDFISYIGSKEAAEGDTISIKSTTLNIRKAIVQNNATLVFEGQNLNISDSKISFFKSVASNTYLDGSIGFTDVTLSNKITFTSSISQINVEDQFTFESANVVVDKVNKDSPIVVSDGGLKISNSIVTLYFEEEPSQLQSFIIFRTVGIFEGSFSSVSMYLESGLVDPNSYSASVSNSAFILIYSDQVSSSSILSSSIILILLSILSILL